MKRTFRGWVANGCKSTFSILSFQEIGEKEIKIDVPNYWMILSRRPKDGEFEANCYPFRRVSVTVEVED